MVSSNWIFSKRQDLLILFLPVWLCWIVSFLLPEDLLLLDLPLWVWIVFVIGIDVSHVWSSIFRTYLDPEEFRNHRILLLLAPIFAFLFSYLIASFSTLIFWRCLAYIAGFHFIKQQYGFMRIYKAKARDFKPTRITDDFIIYFAMLYPVVFWHINPNRNFEWFVPGDFLTLSFGDLSAVNTIGSLLYFLIIGYWLYEQIRLGNCKNSIGKVLWVLTTAGNWYIGIVYFNSDLVFTITNVVAHGLPYLGLVIIYQRKKSVWSKGKRLTQSAVVILLVVMLLAFSEEYLWDLLVYRDNEQFFSNLLPYKIGLPSPQIQVIATALLSLPQLTHYIIDGFIWKNNAKNPHLKSLLTS